MTSLAGFSGVRAIDQGATSSSCAGAARVSSDSEHAPPAEWLPASRGQLDSNRWPVPSRAITCPRHEPESGRPDSNRHRELGRLLCDRYTTPAWSLIGATGFEPATARPPAECATRLRHAPLGPILARGRRLHQSYDGALCDSPDSSFSSAAGS